MLLFLLPKAKTIENMSSLESRVKRSFAEKFFETGRDFDKYFGDPSV